MKFTLNWNITTYEATATGGREGEAPTIIALSMKKGTWPGNVARYRHFLTNIPDLLLSLTNIPDLLLSLTNIPDLLLSLTNIPDLLLSLTNISVLLIIIINHFPAAIFS